MCLECQDKKMSRRNFLAFSTVAVAGATLQTCGVEQNESVMSQILCSLKEGCEKVI